MKNIIFILVMLLPVVSCADRAERLSDAVMTGDELYEARRYSEAMAAYTEAEMLANNGETAKAAIAFGKLGEYKDARGQSLLLWNDIA